MNKFNLFRVIIGIILLIISFFIKNSILEYICYAILAIDIFIKMLKNIKSGEIFDENLLMFIATLGALIIGENHEAIIVVLLYQIGEALSDRAIDKSKEKIISLMDLRSDKIRLKDGKIINPEEVKINDIIIVKPGEKVPVDGVVISGESEIDTKSLTGESKPYIIKKGDNILSGTINIDSILEIKVTADYQNSTSSKIIDLIENSNEKKSKSEKFITRFSKIYTPIVIVLAILLTIIPTIIFNQELNKWLYRSLVFLVVSCPCALVISVPLSFFIGVGISSKNGILIKGANELENISNIDIAVFDKTGTLTKGNFKVIKIIPQYKTKEELLKIVAYAEANSNHPIAKAIKEEYKENIDTSIISDYKEITGKGVSLTINDDKVIVGNRTLLDDNKIKYPKVDFIGTVLLVALNNEYIGTIVIGDEIKEECDDLVNKLKELKIKKVIMLSGDNGEIVKKVGRSLKMDESYAELLPVDKVELITEFKKNGKVLFVGDGINDAPVITLADIGVSMGGIGSDAALEASDIVIMNDNLNKLIDVFNISILTKKIVKQNIVFAILVKVIVLILSMLGITNMWLAIFADVGVTILTIINAFKIIKYK